ncbi:MAG: hypothetical protein AAB596_00625 [Patescibacteria group bacterium]
MCQLCFQTMGGREECCNGMHVTCNEEHMAVKEAREELLKVVNILPGVFKKLTLAELATARRFRHIRKLAEQCFSRIREKIHQFHDLVIKSIEIHLRRVSELLRIDFPKEFVFPQLRASISTQ